jgi:hypothetical protein
MKKEILKLKKISIDIFILSPIKNPNEDHR